MHLKRESADSSASYLNVQCHIKTLLSSNYIVRKWATDEIWPYCNLVLNWDTMSAGGKNTSANVTHKPAQIGWVKCNISVGHISMPSHVYVCVFSGCGLFFCFLSSLSISVPLYAPFSLSHSFPCWTKAIESTLFCTEKFLCGSKIIKHNSAIVDIFYFLKHKYFWTGTIHRKRTTSENSIFFYLFPSKVRG